MSIEQPVRMPTEDEVRAFENKMKIFIEMRPEYTDFASEEVLTAAMLVATRLIRSGKSAEDMDDDMMQRALEARRTVRGSEKILVSDSQGVVIGAASSSNEARRMAQLDSEERDSG